MIRVGIIGYGKMGKAYQKNIQKNSIFKIIKILKKKKNKKKVFTTSEKVFFAKKYDLIIISSPAKFHYFHLKKSIKKKCDIIIEKPIVTSRTQLSKIKKFSIYKKKILVHYKYGYNSKYSMIKKKLRSYTNVTLYLYCGKYQITKKNDLKPFFDWFPHPLFLLIDVFGVPKKFFILKNKNFKIKGNIFTEIIIKFYFNNIICYLNFTNYKNAKNERIVFSKKNIKNIFLKSKTIPNLLNASIKNNSKINDINISIKIMNLLFRINDLLTTSSKSTKN